MCKNKNMGGRCASHTKIALTKAKVQLKMNPTHENLVKLDTAKVDYFSTPSGYERFMEAAMQLSGTDKIAARPVIEGIDARRELNESMKGVETSPYSKAPQKYRAHVIFYLTNGRAEEEVMLTREQKEHVKLACELAAARDTAGGLSLHNDEKIGDHARAKMLEWKYATTKMGFIETLREQKRYNSIPQNASKMKACAQMHKLDPITRQSYIDRLVTIDVDHLKDRAKNADLLKTSAEKARIKGDMKAKAQFEAQYKAMFEKPQRERRKIYEEIDARVSN